MGRGLVILANVIVMLFVCWDTFARTTAEYNLEGNGNLEEQGHGGGLLIYILTDIHDIHVTLEQESTACISVKVSLRDI